MDGVRQGTGQFLTGSGQVVGGAGTLIAMPLKLVAVGPQLLMAVPAQALTTSGQAISGAPAAAPTTGGLFNFGHRNVVARGPSWTVRESGHGWFSGLRRGHGH